MLLGSGGHHPQEAPPPHSPVLADPGPSFSGTATSRTLAGFSTTPIFFAKLYWEAELERGREKGLPPAGSYPKRLQRPELGRSRARSLELLQLQGPSTGVISHCFPGHGGSWSGSAAWKRKLCPYGCQRTTPQRQPPPSEFLSQLPASVWGPGIAGRTLSVWAMKRHSWHTATRAGAQCPVGTWCPDTAGRKLTPVKHLAGNVSGAGTLHAVCTATEGGDQTPRGRSQPTRRATQGRPRVLDAGSWTWGEEGGASC